MGKVEQRAYHGQIEVEPMAQALAAQFDTGTTHARWLKLENGAALVQVWSRRVERDDPVAMLTLRLTPSATGIVATMSEERVEGVFLDLVKTGVKALLQPLSLLGELDDVARNIQQLRLRDAVWEAVEQYCREEEATKGGGPMAHVVCPYCGTPNPVGQLTCSACHAPLAEVQPIACPRCGFLNDPENARCVQCGAILKQRS